MATIFSSRIVRLRDKTQERLNTYSRPQAPFYVLSALSAAIAALGLVLDSPAVVIGAMLVAPLITPVFGFALGLIVLQLKDIAASFVTVLLGSVTVVAIAAGTSWLAQTLQLEPLVLTEQIMARAEPNILYFLVAIASGMAGAYAYTHEDLLESVAGIAISVAVIPPLAVVGVGLVMNNWLLVESSATLYAFNLAGIVFGSILSFLSIGFGKEIEKAD